MTESVLQVRAPADSFRSGAGRVWGVLTMLVVSAAAVHVEAETATVIAEDPAPLTVVDLPASSDRLAYFIWQRQAADQALLQGFPSIAARLYRGAAETLPENDYRHPEVEIGLATALLATGRYDAAAEVLDGYRGALNDAVLLRRAILSWNGQRWDELRYRLIEITPGALAGKDLGWYYFLRGHLSEVDGAVDLAEEWYRRAEEASVSEVQQAQFVLARYRSGLFAEEPDARMVERLRAQMEVHAGTEAGFRFAQKYVIALEMVGRRDDAVASIAANIQRVPEVERELRDRFLLLDGLIRGADTEDGREAFETLIRNGSTRRLQRAALYELGRDLPEGEELARLKQLLTDVIETEPPHSLIDEILVFRARISFVEREFEEASEDAETVLSQYPGSRLRKDSLRLLAHIAWEEEKFRTAADFVTRLREETPEGERRAELGVLIADCYFRAEDYNNAADAYGNVLRERPERIAAGLLLFQRVQAELRGGRLERAIEHLEGAGFQTIEDLDYLWQAEWNLLKTLQRRGRVGDAYGRVTELLESGYDYPLPASLRVRFLWLQAQLSFETGHPEDTLSLVDIVLAELMHVEERADLPENLRESIRAYAMLIQAQALLETGRSEEAVSLLQKLRESHQGSEPAIYSYLAEARYQSDMGKSVEAQRLLLALADEYPESPYAPIALYEAAITTERGGLDEGYQERSINRLERLVERYPNHELAFYARLKQADILREMNRFGTARQIYESLENRHPDHPDWFRVKVSLADTLLAQGERGDAAFHDRALVALERLYDLPHLTPDMRAEAGFKYGFAYEKVGNRDRAEEVFWLVIAGILENEENLERVGSNGRYWVSRSIFHLGRILEDTGRWGEAREAYALISIHRLPGEDIARSRLSPLTAR